MEVIKDILRRFIREASINKLMREVWRDSRLKEYYIELNQEQLYEHGTDSNGNEIQPAYTFATVFIKRSKGQKADHVTLKDTGKFYKSFRIGIYSEGFIIDADGQKDETNLFDKYGIDILGLNAVNQWQFNQILIREIREKVIQMLSVDWGLPRVEFQQVYGNR